MEDEVGNPDFPIWMLGDSEPKNWSNLLHAPFDSRHPAVHNIWSPIVSIIQEILYSDTDKLRLDENKIYKRNPIKDRKSKPTNKEIIWDNIKGSIVKYEELLVSHKPVFVFTFGSFSFEFACRAIETNHKPNRWDYWRTDRLGAEFLRRMENINFSSINIIPLLHASIARGRFLKSHSTFTQKELGNYFVYTGQKIGKCFLNERTFLKSIVCH